MLVQAVLEVETEVVEWEGGLADTKAGWRARHKIGHKMEMVVEHKRTIGPPKRAVDVVYRKRHVVEFSASFSTFL